MSGLSGQFVNTRVPRDRMKRPLVIPPRPDKKDPGKRVAYRRVTRFISVLEDRYNLELHAQREIIWGMGARPDLVLMASSMPGNWNETGDGKMAMAGNKDSIAEQARDAAQTAAKANTGTALHQFAENLDRGHLDWRRVPNENKGDIEAYWRTTREIGMEMLAVETFRVHDLWKVAGTADRIVRIGNRCYIADIKTGKITFDGAILKMAMQLAMYAHSEDYDPETDTRRKDPFRMDMNQGVIIHLPPGQGICDLYWLNINFGWRACHQAKKLWELRDAAKENKLLSPLTRDTLPPEDRVVVPTIEEYISKACIANSVEELESIWRSAAYFGRASDQLIAACTQRKAVLQQNAAA